MSCTTHELRYNPTGGSLMWRSRPKILLVDDEPAALHALRLLLERRFEVDTAATAEEAKRMAGVRAYTAVLAVHGLPGCTGAWLLTYLSATRPGLHHTLSSARAAPPFTALSFAPIV